LTRKCLLEGLCAAFQDRPPLSVFSLNKSPVWKVDLDYHSVGFLDIRHVSQVRDRYPDLFYLPIRSLQQFLWQEDIIQVINFVVDCFALRQTRRHVQPSSALWLRILRRFEGFYFILFYFVFMVYLVVFLLFLFVLLVAFSGYLWSCIYTDCCNE
jgi:hypothetical protein